MIEFLQNLGNSEIFVTLMGVLTANLGTIVGVIIYAVKQGLKNSASKEEFQKECKIYVEEAKANCLEILDKVSGIVQQMQFNICDKIDANEANKKQEIEAQKIELTKTIEESKKMLSIDEILDK